MRQRIPNRSGPARRLTACAVGAATALVSAGAAGFVAPPAVAASPDVVISQVYGGGGNSGATYTHDFVELQNRGTAAVDVTGWSVQYASASGSTWQVTVLSGTIPGGGRYLVQEARGAGGTTGLPAPDVSGTIAMSATSGKVALVTSTGALGCASACAGDTAAGVRDFVGYGSADDAEGTPAPGLSNTTAALRGSGADTDDNAADFTAAAPSPRGSGGSEPPPTPTDCSAADVAVGAVQGDGDVSPLAGSTVTVQGTVVGDYEGPSPALRGFYLQDGGDGDPATSDGVFVFNNLGNASPDTVSLGRLVQVTGTAGEFQGQTQVTAAAIAVCSDGAGADPVDVTLPRASAGDLEPYEGMLVRLPQTLTVTEHFQLGRFGQVVVSSGGRLRQPTAVVRPGPDAVALQAANALDRLILDDARNDQNPDPILLARGGLPLSAANTLRGGDTVTGAVGVLTYTWAGNAASGNAFRLRPVNALGGSATFEAANPRPAGPPEVGGTLKVASFNLLNFFDTFTGCSYGVGGAPADCRGAENATEFGRQLAKTVPAITSLGADVVGVMELENDGYGDGTAISALVDALNAAQGAGSWAWVDPDAATGVANAAGTDAIRVALLYRPAAVTAVPGRTFTDAARADVWDRVPVAQTFRTRTGADVTVVTNHFKSKGSCPAAGTDPGNEDGGDGQSCWNARRVAQAERLASWIDTDVRPVAGDDVLVIGDLNAYAEEDPIAALEAAGYVNLPRALHGDATYSYVFDGQWGHLDHALASPSLAAKTSGADEVHINADEPSVLDYNTNFKSAAQLDSLYAPDRFRTSDHDPVLAGFDVRGATTTTVTSSDPAVRYRGPVRWTATVGSPGEDAPTGAVQFTLGGEPLGAPVPLVDGVATSPETTALPPGATEVGAVYGGSAGNAPSTGTLSQQVRFGVAVVRPADGSSARAGSTVQVRVVLTDARGTVPDAVARAWAAHCRVTVEVAGAQTLAPTCVRHHDARGDRLTLRWRTDRAPRGDVTVTAAVTYPGIADADTAAATLRLR